MWCWAKIAGQDCASYEWIHLQMLIWEEQKQQSWTMRLQVTIFYYIWFKFSKREGHKGKWVGERLLQTGCLHWKISWKKKKSISREGLRIISNLILTKGFLNYFCLSLHCKQSKCRRFAARKNNPVSQSFWIAITNSYNKQWKCTPHNSGSRESRSRYLQIQYLMRAGFLVHKD